MILLAGVPIADVARAWPYVEPWLRLPCEACGVWTIEEAQERCHSGHAALWIIFDNTNAVGALVTECEGESAWVALIGGSGALRGVKNNIELIETWARDQGAKRMQMAGRKGWIRVLRHYGYQADGTTVQKEL